MKIISEKEKKRRQHEKELNSLTRKMGSDLVWFMSLSKEKQYDFLFLWKKEKWSNKLEKPEILTSRNRKFKIINYPPNFKFFKSRIISYRSFATSRVRLRESALNILLGIKK